MRELRIAALRDSPESFAASAGDAAARPISYWIDLTESLVEKNVMFLIEIDDKPRGSVYGLTTGIYF